MSRHMSTHTLRIMSMHRSMYMPVHMSIQIDACTDIYADVHAGVHTHTWTHAFTRLRMPVYMSIPVFTATQPTTAPSAREVATSMQRSEPTQCRLMSPRSPVRRSIPTRHADGASAVQSDPSPAVTRATCLRCGLKPRHGPRDQGRSSSHASAHRPPWWPSASADP